MKTSWRVEPSLQLNLDVTISNHICKQPRQRSHPEDWNHAPDWVRVAIFLTTLAWSHFKQHYNSCSCPKEVPGTPEGDRKPSSWRREGGGRTWPMSKLKETKSPIWCHEGDVVLVSGCFFVVVLFAGLWPMEKMHHTALVSEHVWTQKDRPYEHCKSCPLYRGAVREGVVLEFICPGRSIAYWCLIVHRPKKELFLSNSPCLNVRSSKFVERVARESVKERRWDHHHQLVSSIK